MSARHGLKGGGSNADWKQLKFMGFAAIMITGIYTVRCNRSSVRKVRSSGKFSVYNMWRKVGIL